MTSLAPTGARVVSGIRFSPCPTKNLARVKCIREHVDTMSVVAAAILARGAFLDVILVAFYAALFHAVPAVLHARFAQWRTQGLSRRDAPRLWALTAMLLLACSIAGSVSQPTLLSSFLLLHAEWLIEFVERFGNWGLTWSFVAHVRYTRVLSLLRVGIAVAYAIVVRRRLAVAAPVVATRKRAGPLRTCSFCVRLNF